ncbi:hypothetical protein F441_22285 [Phytophthora nicotianae CJ01A1]|uniref:Uncharacterized protein n=2 Tax=Phytophthora nicotianae TaxID=4792 RepID=W2LME1_PHYNI|nr:hypothetical protein L915_14383 [Phytophthora nicotianae]ETL33198.1 hypothetical protein L916_14292 [Phytophthora nicotianae]ETL98633.1 hypothetical protein L917_04336 [Phytophthora nicotianae]ETP00294.1 hypothetical protein F441_22285 [Phytophthora nicotianae CJ01A1]
MSMVPDYGGALPKKYKDAKNPIIKDLGIPALYRMIMLAPSGSGKTNMAFHIIKHSPNVYAYLHVICRNPNQPLYDYLRDKLEGFISFYDPDSAPTVDQIRHTPLTTKKPELVIFDDITTDKHVLEKLANSKRDLQAILKDFNLVGVNEAMIFRAYNKCTAHIGQALVIDGTKGQMRWNFDMVLNPGEL